MLKLHHIVNEHPSWFSSEWFLLKHKFIENICLYTQNWALQKTESDSLEEIQTLQLRRLKKLIQHAYKTVPFWRKRMDIAGIHPKDIKSLDDISKIPATSKLVIKDLYKVRKGKEFISKQHSREQLYTIYTSGTTGIPVKIFVDMRTKERRLAIRNRGLRWIVGKRKKQDTYIRISKVNTFYPGFIVFYIPDIDVLHEVKEKLLKFYENKTCVVTTHPSYMIHFAKLIQKDRRTFPLKGIVVSGEVLEAPLKKLLEEVFQCQVGERYTSSEGSGTLAHTCSMGRFHTNPDQCLIEVVDKNGNPTPSGTSGKILVTDFNNYIMPFIRYEIGDIGTLSPSICECGCIFPIIEFKGRDSMITNLACGKSIHSFVLLNLFAIRSSWIMRYQIIRKSLHKFEILLIIMPNCTKDDIYELKEAIEQLLGKDIIIDIKVVHEIKIDNNEKFRSFVSNVPEDNMVSELKN